MHDNRSLPPLDEPVTPEELARIGVERRGWAGEGEGIAEMGAFAARRALARAEVAPETLDLIVLANWTQRRYIPEHAPALQRLLGAARAFAFDVCGACTGFVYGLAIARAFLHEPRHRRALVVASETTSRRARPGSKGTLILGDGAGAFVLDKDARGPGALIDVELATHGAHHEIMEISPEGWVRTHIPQRELNALAARSIAAVCAPLLQRNRLDWSDIDWFIPHSGTAGVQAAIARELPIQGDRILANFASIGNVSSASIPAALDEHVAAGRVKPGQLVVSAAVGTGWYAAGMLYRP
jgi:3-oxoacyl-[acyl-carrier-protein] synthase-3